MVKTPVQWTTLLVVAFVVAGCAGKPRQLMPTPVLYQEPGAASLFGQPTAARGTSTDVDLLYITNRGRETDPQSTLRYGETRSNAIAFGSARVQIGPDASWETLERESRRANRTRDMDLSLGQTKELARFPEQPYAVEFRPDGVYREAGDMRRHHSAEQAFRKEIERRLAESPNNEVVLYVHGFNETFASAAFTAAELCHFLGREPVCAFFSWPASSSGNFLTSYTSTTESARYAENDLRKMIRLLATAPGVERLQLLAHSRGSAVLLSALRDLFTEVIAAGKEPINTFRIDNLVLFSPDIDVDLAFQDITSEISDPSMFSVWPSGRLPRSLHGRLTIYSSPEDRALLVSKILFRSSSRVGNLRAEDISEATQRYLAPFDKIDIIVYEGRRTDAFGHSYFTTNPRVSSDVIELLRFDKKPGEPGRELQRAGPVTWKFPKAAD